MRAFNPKGLREHLDDLVIRPPTQLDAELDKLGYRGQPDARRALCLMAYRHVERLRRVHVEGYLREALPARTNVLCMGPTGCGKTYIVELLFERVLGLPCTVVDITGYSETGYVGGDVHSIPSRLVDAAVGNVDLARGGVIVLDEFDKLATSENRAVFAGAETTKDVSGRGVQRELLKMIEGSAVDSQQGISARDRITFDTRDVAFVACGAFSGLKLSTAKRSEVGFNREQHARVEHKIAVKLESREAEDVEALSKYGFLPELIGRFGRLVVFDPLERDTLREILTIELDRHRAEFALEGLALEVDAGALEAVVERAHQRQTGARGLSGALLRAIEDAAFEHFGKNRTGAIVVKKGKGEQLEARFERGKAPARPVPANRSPEETEADDQTIWTVGQAPDAQVRAIIDQGLTNIFKLKRIAEEDLDALVSSLPPHADARELVDTVALFAWDKLGRPPTDDRLLAGKVRAFHQFVARQTGGQAI